MQRTMTAGVVAAFTLLTIFASSGCAHDDATEETEDESDALSQVKADQLFADASSLAERNVAGNPCPGAAQSDILGKLAEALKATSDQARPALQTRIKDSPTFRRALAGNLMLHELLGEIKPSGMSGNYRGLETVIRSEAFVFEKIGQGSRIEISPNGRAVVDGRDTTWTFKSDSPQAVVVQKPRAFGLVSSNEPYWVSRSELGASFVISANEEASGSYYNNTQTCLRDGTATHRAPSNRQR